MNEEESRDRKQSGTGGEGEADKNTKRRNRGARRGERERGEKLGGRNPGRLREAKILLSLPLERAERKKKERSKVRASGPDTDRFSRDTDEGEEGSREEGR